ncbi:MAG: hypothetical protein JW863_05430 [Chitinispirillaceae bacterium]|nr:hypothetical protein [Chitinispirillaceae bacterium]
MERLKKDLLFAKFLIILFTAGCGINDKVNEDDTLQFDSNCISERAIELISPIGGETCSLGQDVHIKWRVNADSLKPGLILLQITHDSLSGPWKEVFNRGIWIPDTTGFFCMDTIWNVGNEWDLMNYNTPDYVFLRIVEYNNPREVETMSGALRID